MAEVMDMTLAQCTMYSTSAEKIHKVELRDLCQAAMIGSSLSMKAEAAQNFLKRLEK